MLLSSMWSIDIGELQQNIQLGFGFPQRRCSWLNLAYPDRNLTNIVDSAWGQFAGKVLLVPSLFNLKYQKRSKAFSKSVAKMAK